MNLTAGLSILLILAASLGLALWSRRRSKRLFLASHTIEAHQLHAILTSGRAPALQIIDVRQPLDLLASSQVIPGSRRIPPRDILENPALLAKDQDTVVYCTCPSDETAGKIMQRAVSLGFEKVKVLRGGLEAWKANQYPLETYESVFHLDTPA